MCGIIGALNARNDIAPILLQGLQRMEYRGYDSAGIAVQGDNGEILRIRREGKLSQLQQAWQAEPISGRCGIGHTRWATHGVVSEANTHPLMTERLAIAHNGIIDNHADLRARHKQLDNRFTGETDTEIILLLIDAALAGGAGLPDAIASVLPNLRGVYALAIVSREDSLLWGIQSGAPLVIGHSEEGGGYLGSDALSLGHVTDRITYLEDGDRVELRVDGLTIFNRDGRVIERRTHRVAASWAGYGKGPFRHFMEKEIHDQPIALADTLNGLIDQTSRSVTLSEPMHRMARCDRLVLAGCGTAYLAARVGKIWLERMAGIPVDVDISSEFRYRDAAFGGDGGMIVLSQSGETADTLAALRHARTKHWPCFSIVNRLESAIARESDYVLPSPAGIEIGVAATKTFTAQLMVLACLAIGLAVRRGRISVEEEKASVEALIGLPGLITGMLDDGEMVEAVAASLAADAHHVFFLGRDTLFPLACEGALKLMEISYIHATGYPAGELKHGPLALIERGSPVVALLHSGLFPEKMLSNLSAVAARGACIYTIADQPMAASQNLITIPSCSALCAPFLMAVRVQQLAYHTARCKGTDIDQPRNLAKSVTVE